MSLKDAFEKAAKAIFDVADDCLEDIIYKQVSDNGYDPETGTVTEVETEIVLKGLAETTQCKDRFDDHVDEARQLFYILADDLGVEPKVGDLIVSGGIEKKVVDWAADPIKCVWEIGLAW